MSDNNTNARFDFDFERFCTLLEADSAFQYVERRPVPDPDRREVYFSARSRVFSVLSLYFADDNYNDVSLWTWSDNERRKDGRQANIYLESTSSKDITPEEMLHLLETWFDTVILDDLPQPTSILQRGYP